MWYHARPFLAKRRLLFFVVAVARPVCRRRVVCLVTASRWSVCCCSCTSAIGFLCTSLDISVSSDLLAKPRALSVIM
jgi:hypothetical protein